MAGQHVWEWYFDISEALVRIRDGVCIPIPPSEFVAWKEATGTIVHPHEYAILQAMDAAYCNEMNRELADHRERENERREASMRAATAKATKRGRKG